MHTLSFIAFTMLIGYLDSDSDALGNTLWKLSDATTLYNHLNCLNSFCHISWFAWGTWNPIGKNFWYREVGCGMEINPQGDVMSLNKYILYQKQY